MLSVRPVPLPFAAGAFAQETVLRCSDVVPASRPCVPTIERVSAG